LAVVRSRLSGEAIEEIARTVELKRRRAPDTPEAISHVEVERFGAHEQAFAAGSRPMGRHTEMIHDLFTSGMSMLTSDSTLRRAARIASISAVVQLRC
jgi:predicted amidophosphoribosyltransferase